MGSVFYAPLLTGLPAKSDTAALDKSFHSFRWHAASMISADAERPEAVKATAGRPWAAAWIEQGVVADTWIIRCCAGHKSSGGGLSLPFGASVGGGGGGAIPIGTRLRPGVPIPTWICNTVQVCHCAIPTHVDVKEAVGRGTIVARASHRSHVYRKRSRPYKRMFSPTLSGRRINRSTRRHFLVATLGGY